MISTTTRLLDKAMRQHRLRSDYKLALVMGVSSSSLSSYRAGKTLPDARVVAKICELTDDDPALIAVEIEAERARTPEARQLWQNIAARLQMGFTNCKFLAVLAILSIAVSALPAWAAIGIASTAAEQSVYYVKRLICRLVAHAGHFAYKCVNLCKHGQNVSRNPHAAAFRAA